MKTVRPQWVVIKAVVLYALVNLAFAYFNPPVGKFSLYNWLIPGRARVPYEREVEYYEASHTIPVYEDLDAMYQSTLLAQPKQPDEFRVFLLGDSSAWGFQLHPEETLVGQLNALNLKTCAGKRIVVYNAAFPLPYVMKDLILLDKAREYQPDLFLWTVTLDGFRNRTIFTNYFLDPYAERVQALAEEYQLTNLDLQKLETPTFWDQTLIGQRGRLKKIFLLQVHGLGWAATGLDYDYRSYPPLSPDVTADDTFFETPPGKLGLEDHMLFNVLEAGYQLAAPTPVLVINEPIFVASGKNSEIRYNEFYPRWAYDEYLTYLQNWMRVNQHDYVDAWNLLPPAEFTDTPFHRTPAGERKFAELLLPQIQKLACPK
ncbi:MAG: SGNH/GDSL hydrolase family protein [Anaerolineales bacterium]|nr:SGNH/GDSL hydrolase family protein [Anaerolineales bacterium]